MNGRNVRYAAFVAFLAFATACQSADQPASAHSVEKLAEEVRDKGWIVYCARSQKGDWDLFLMRPDGSNRRNITNTPDFEEAAPRFSPDGKRLLYRRLLKRAIVDHDSWGVQGQLVIANSDGTKRVTYGTAGEYPWASWGPRGKRIACMTENEIQIIDLSTKEIVARFDRKGIYQQCTWSPDGEWFSGTAVFQRKNWTIVRVNAGTGELNVVSKVQCCTPDWFPDSLNLIFSHRPTNQEGSGWTQLWMADGEGKTRSLLYGEDGVHIYGGALSPDGRYVLFSRCPEDGGGAERSGAPMALMRHRDAPTIHGESKALRKVHPNTKDGPVLHLPVGWEPHWTYANIRGK